MGVMEKYIQLLLLVMTCISICNCMMRPDFNIVFTLLGSYIWASLEEKEQERYEAVKSYSILVATVSIIDVAYLVLDSRDWACANKLETLCFAGKAEKFEAEMKLHTMTLFGAW